MLLDPTTTAVVVVDMWDKHTCKTLEQYLGQLANRLNHALPYFRQWDVPIVWMADDVWQANRDDLRFKRLAMYKHWLPDEPWEAIEHPRPPGDDVWWNGCICEEGHCKGPQTWTRLHPDLYIGQWDYIGWGQMLWGLVIGQGIKTLLYAGATLNVCVLDTRSFSVCQSLGAGIDCVVMGDLTEPYITGLTQAEAREELYLYYRRYICPVVNSTDVQFSESRSTDHRER